MTPRPNNQRLAQDLVRLGRPQNIVYSGLLAAVVCYHHTHSLYYATVCYLALYVLYGLATAYNNLHDQKTDRVNKRHDNPLTRNLLTRLHLRWFFGAYIGLLVLIQAILAQPWSFAICVTYVALALAYSHPRINLQAKGIVAPLLLAVCYGSLPVLLGSVQGGHWDISLALLQVPLLTAALLGKDYKDVLGDRATGKRTFLVRYGKTATLWAACGFLGLGFAFVITNHVALVTYGLFTLYAILCIRLHVRRGKVEKHYLRISQLCALGISWLVLFS